MILASLLVAQGDFTFDGDMQPEMVEFSPLMLLPILGIYLIMMAVFGAFMWWGMFTKAGKPGWHSIIPFWNVVVWLQIVGRPGWWFILMFIPLVNLIIVILACVDTSKSFGKGTGFTIGLVLLGVIFFPILSWGPDKYLGPGGGGQAPPLA